MTLLLPTRNVLGLGLLVVALWYAGASQSNGAAYLLCFLVTSVALVSGLHTWANLRGVTVSAETPRPMYAGQAAALPVELMNGARVGRHALALRWKGSAPAVVGEIGPGKAARAELRFTAPGRGEHTVHAVTLASAYPLGFFRARRRIGVARDFIVYPRPEGRPHRGAGASRAAAELRSRAQVEGDDFAGTRAYVLGESQRHIDWRAAARGQPLLIKQFAADAGETVWVEWEQASGEVEARLSQLALWVVEAERTGAPYGLRLPGAEFAPARGDAHFHRCMRTLALYQP